MIPPAGQTFSLNLFDDYVYDQILVGWLATQQELHTAFCFSVKKVSNTASFSGSSVKESQFSSATVGTVSTLPGVSGRLAIALRPGTRPCCHWKQRQRTLNKLIFHGRFDFVLSLQTHVLTCFLSEVCWPFSGWSPQTGHHLLVCWIAIQKPLIW